MDSLDTSARLAQAAALVGLGTVRLDYASQTVVADERGAALYGLPADEPVPRTTFRDRIPPEDRPAVERHIEAALAPDGDGTFALEHRVRRPDGTEAWLSVHMQVEFEGGAARWATVAAVDITSRRETEAGLRASEARFRAVQQTTPDGFMVFESVRDETGRIVDFEWLFANPAVGAITGREPSDLIGKRLLVEMPGNRDEGLFDAYARVVETGESWQREFSYRHEGLDHWFRSAAARAGDGFAVSFADITESKRQQEEVREALDRLQLALSAAEMGTWAWDLHTDRVVPDQRLRRVFGLPAEGDVPSEAVFTSVHPDDLPELWSAIEDAQRRDIPYAAEFRVVTPEGTVRWISSRGETIRDEDGMPARMAGIGFDITERREAERRLQESERKRLLAIEAARLGTFTADAATGLIAIDGRMQSLLGLPESPSLEEFLWRIHPDDHARIERYRALLREAPDSGPYRFGFRSTHGAIHVEASLLGVPDPDGALAYVIGTVQDVSERVEAAEAGRLRQLLEAMSVQGPFLDRATAVLQKVTELLGLDGGLLARIQGGVFTCLARYAPTGVTAALGDSLPLDKTFCDLTIQANDLIAIEHIAESEHRDHPCFEAVGLETYIGVPVVIEERPFGGISFFSTRPASRPFTEGDLELVRLAGQWAGALIELDLRQREAVAQADRIRALANAFTLTTADNLGALSGVVAVLRDLLGLELGILSRVTASEDRYEVVVCAVPEGGTLRPGDVFPFGETYCAITLDTGDLVAIEHMERSRYHGHPCYEAFALESYIGAAVVVEGEPWGTLNFSSATPRAAPFSEADRNLVRLAARWIGGLLAMSQEAAARADAEREATARAAELERSNAELDRFAYVASHDLKAPLRAIDSLATWIAEDVGDTLPPESARHLDLLRQRAARMEGLLDSLLAYSRAGRAEGAPKEVATDALVRDVLGLIDPPPGMTVELAGDFPRVVTQPAPLALVFRNLVGNAVKHHGSGDGRVVVSGETDGPFARFAVEDDGPGVAPEYRERVFEMFQTLRPRDEVEGSGMGLAIVKKTVENRGGAITLGASALGGARFSFTWPLTPPPSPWKSAA